MGSRENNCESSENACKHKQNFVVSFISPVLLRVSYEVFIRFRPLLLLEMIFVEKVLKIVVQKFAIRCE